MKPEESIKSDNESAPKQDADNTELETQNEQAQTLQEPDAHAVAGYEPGLQLDSSDPVVVAFTWALTWAAGKLFVKAGLEKARKFLPGVAILAAIACRVVFDSMAGIDFSTDALLHALAAAGVAVLGHSQFREIVKLIAKNKAEPDESDCCPE